MTCIYKGKRVKYYIVSEKTVEFRHGFSTAKYEVRFKETVSKKEQEYLHGTD